MASNFPTSLDNFTNPSSGNTLDSPSHSLQHSDINDAVEALEAKLGIGASPAGSATSGQVLTASTGGTTTWTTPSAGGLIQLVPSSVSVGSGSGSANANGKVTFTGASSVSLNNVFSATYENYRVVVNVDSFSSTGTNILNGRFGTNGTANSGSSYHQKGYYADGAATFYISNSGANIFYLATTPAATTTEMTSQYEIQNPFTAKNTYFTGISSGSRTFANLRYQSTAGEFDATTSFTDFVLFPSANNMTGTVSIYGYRN